MNEQQPTNAWLHAEERYQPDLEVRGVVTRMTPFGVFVQVEPGIEGIIYTFELGTGALASCTPGREMHLYVKSIDVSRKRLELSLDKASAQGLLHEGDLPSAVRSPIRPDEPPRPVLRSLPETPTSGHSASCPTCQRQVQPTWKFCVFCGGSLYRRCAACGSVQPDLPDAHYCYECGKSI